MIRFAVDHPVPTIMLFAALLVTGIYAVPNLDIEGTGTLGPNPAVDAAYAAHPDRPIPTHPKEPAP